ncbi:MAG: serpin family protein [Anaerolineae bacterium]|nr:serpin family protein [Anaerolineae bacterium]MDW8102011.1 serpin family protein [Anaerolineae bacterium]
MSRFLLLGVILLSILTGCAEPPVSVVEARTLRSDKPRITSPQVPDEDLQELVRGNTAFALDLYQMLRKTAEGNLFYSPYSISIALAMTYAGARGETEKEMARTLHFTLPQNRLHPAFNRLDLELASRGQVPQGEGRGFRLRIANALWGHKDYEFLPEFLDVLAQNYGAGLMLVDFVSDPEGARRIINEWVSDQTEGRIRELIPPGTIDILTRLILTNAIYFNAAWAEPFDKELTADGTFHLLDGRKVTVPMMRQTTNLGYTEGEGYQAVEIPYEGQELAMVILLPAEGNFEAFEESLRAERLQEILQGIKYQQVALTLPRFRVESAFHLAEALKAMGMQTAFTPYQADFSGMDGTRDLYIGHVFHKAFVSVDEEGTEAAAATAVVVRVTALPVSLVEVTVDRPFIFFIRDIQTGAIIFFGRVVDPAS